MRYTRQNLINIYNATSKEHPKGSDKIESYEHWLERQLISRIAKIEKLEAKAIDLEEELKKYHKWLENPPTLVDEQVKEYLKQRK